MVLICGGIYGTKVVIIEEDTDIEGWCWCSGNRYKRRWRRRGS